MSSLSLHFYNVMLMLERVSGERSTDTWSSLAHLQDYICQRSKFFHTWVETQAQIWPEVTRRSRVMQPSHEGERGDSLSLDVNGSLSDTPTTPAYSCDECECNLIPEIHQNSLPDTKVTDPIHFSGEHDGFDTASWVTMNANDVCP